MTSVDLTRSGDCVCGVPVSLHFDRDRMLSCEVAAARFAQERQVVPAPPPQPLPANVHSFFSGRRRGLFLV